jgi:hypothetical protein
MSSEVLISARSGGAVSRLENVERRDHISPSQSTRRYRINLARVGHNRPMCRIAALLAAVFAVGATAIGGVGAASAVQTSARLRLLDTEPLMLRGTGFKPYEHLRIAVVSNERVVRRATAGPGGGFTMRLRGVDLEACAGFSITVTGDEGSSATFKRAPGVCADP